MSQVSKLIHKVWKANTTEVQEMFSDVSEPRRSFSRPETPVRVLPGLIGASSVTLTGKIAEFYACVNGGTNVVAAERWASVAEMSGDFLSVWDDVARFEYGLRGRPDDWKMTRQDWFRDHRFDFEALCDYLELEKIEDFPTQSALVLFGYDLVELAHRKSYLYFPDARGSEPVIFSMWDHSGEPYPNITEYLERSCPVW
ncbi:hypothetical protein [Thalassobius sp. I31.1]|uniref:hypothetical protein n=1 Tax=Thalassobius sp. I31.1 TaxID=2109912 RepID=UPI001300B18E|nr:hypothetical protein [Thalassobius sp. I31.1]